MNTPAPQPNPYQSPEMAAAPYMMVNPQHHPAFLRTAAEYQRGINLSILAQIIAYIAVAGVEPLIAKQVLLGVVGLAGIAGAVYVFLLANHLWGTGLAVACAIGGLIPCINLLILLRVNGSATSLITDAGYNVGLLGADPAQFDAPPPNQPVGMPYPMQPQMPPGSPYPPQGPPSAP